MNQKRGYFVSEIDEDGVGVVATSGREAKKIAYHQELYLYCDWIDMRVRWVKDAEVADLPIGIIRDGKLGLKRGLFSCIEDEPCDMCGNNNLLTLINGKALCDACAEKEFNDDRGGSNHTD